MRVKFFMALVLALVLASGAYASSLRIGALTKYSENPFKDWNIKTGIHGKDDRIILYDNLQSLMMSLFKGDIDEADLPGIVGSYVLKTNPDLKVKCIVRLKSQFLVFGFTKNNEELRDKFNKALSDMKADTTLDALKKRYLKADSKNESSIEFKNFKGAQTIRAAVTGDLPPVDFVGADGKAAGFNAALLAEIAERLKINISLVHVNTSARSSALASGRADIVFWYHLSEYGGKNLDIPEGVIVSEPYYDWDNFFHLSLKN